MIEGLQNDELWGATIKVIATISVSSKSVVVRSLLFCNSSAAMEWLPEIPKLPPYTVLGISDGNKWYAKDVLNQFCRSRCWRLIWPENISPSRYLKELHIQYCGCVVHDVGEIIAQCPNVRYITIDASPNVMIRTIPRRSIKLLLSIWGTLCLESESAIEYVKVTHPHLSGYCRAPLKIEWLVIDSTISEQLPPQITVTHLVTNDLSPHLIHPSAHPKVLVCYKNVGSLGDFNRNYDDITLVFFTTNPISLQDSNRVIYQVAPTGAVSTNPNIRYIRASHPWFENPWTSIAVFRYRRECDGREREREGVPRHIINLQQ